jgi:hypothetical protein
MHVFNVELTCSRKTGLNDQQNSLDRLLVWSAAMTSDKGIQLEAKLRAMLNEILPGALAPVSESAAQTLEALGKDQQLELGVGCQVPGASKQQ